jgi:hypothetical protein
MLHRWCICLALVALAAIAGCGGGSVSQDLNSQNNGDDRQPSDVSNVYETELIAGAGQGWPGFGSDVGDVTICQDGNTLMVEYCLADGYEFDQDANQNLHLYVDDSWPPTNNGGNPTVAPGQFPYAAFVQSPENCYTFEFNMNQMGWDDTLYIAAHAVVCEEGDGGDDNGGDDNGEDCGMWVYDICDGDCEPFGAVTIWAGQHIDAGTAYLSVDEDGENLEVFIDLDNGWEIIETQLWLGTTPYGFPQTPNGNPKIGQFPYGESFSENPPNPTEYTYTVPLTDIPGFFWDGDMAHICMALHVTVGSGSDGEGGYAQGETGWAYCPGGPHEFQGNSWGGSYCFTICRVWDDSDCNGGGGGGGEGCETAWAFDLDGELTENGSKVGDGTPANEDGWFPGMGFNRWGWMITYVTE